ncbi:MAG: RNA polymerase sigma factor [Clostridiales bacterium]|nr:RNA polymerase sigma factor [Clostridiales bacterium]
MTIGELENLIHNYGRDIYNFCLRLTGSRQEAEDLYQDTFLTAMERISRINTAHNPKSYLLSIAFHIWKNQTRKASWRQRIAPTMDMDTPESIPEPASPDSSPEELAISGEERGAVLQAITGLADKYRLPVILYYGQQLSLKEIAAVLSIPVSTVKSRLYQARKLLQKELEVFFHET